MIHQRISAYFNLQIDKSMLQFYIGDIADKNHQKIVNKS